jgi:alanine dehydrogenase
MAVYLTEADVARLITMPLAIEAVEEAFRRLAVGEGVNVPRQRAIAPGVVLHTMSAAAPYLGLVGWKCYTSTHAGAKFFCGLHSTETGELVALVEADRLGQFRTGATTAVAAQYMANPTATELGLFGAGHQAETQLMAVAAVRSLRQVFVYSRDAARRQAFAAEMGERLSLHVEPVDRPQEAVEDLPIVVTATTSRQPVFDGAWLAEGALVCAVGSNWAQKAEIDVTTIRRADNIVCDSIDGCRQEAGDFREALEKGIFDWSRAVELSDVVAGRAVGRNTADSIVLFKSVGMAIEDVAVAAMLLAKAREAGVGSDISQCAQL